MQRLICILFLMCADDSSTMNILHAVPCLLRQPMAPLNLQRSSPASKVRVGTMPRLSSKIAPRQSHSGLICLEMLCLRLATAMSLFLHDFMDILLCKKDLVCPCCLSTMNLAHGSEGGRPLSPEFFAGSGDNIKQT